MEEIKRILKDLKQDNLVYCTKDSSYNPTAIHKLEAFGIIKPKNKYSYALTEKGFKYMDRLLAWNSTLESYPFKDASASSTINISHSNISQLNHQSHHNTLEQITNPVVRETLSETFSKEQLEEIQKIIQENSTPEAKNQSLQDKILSFGSDVGVNALANLLSNPGLYI